MAPTMLPSTWPQHWRNQEGYNTALGKQSSLYFYENAKTFMETIALILIFYCAVYLYSGNKEDNRSPMVPFIGICVLSALGCIIDRGVVLWLFGVPIFSDTLPWIIPVSTFVGLMYMGFIVISRHQEIKC